MIAPLSADSISALCRPAAQQVAIRVVAETGSTNADLMAEVEHLGCPTFLVAEAQTAGKGRAGRAWHAIPGATLTFSLAWKFNVPAQALLGMPLAVGVAVAGALAEFGIGVQLKWPNDILLGGRKLGGILIESANAGAHIWAVIGIGINMQVPEELARRIGQAAAAAPDLQAQRERALASLLSHLAEALLQFEQHGFAAFQARWNALHAYRDVEVDIVEQGRILQQGRAIGVDDSGRLLLATPQGQVAVLAGDVSLRSQVQARQTS
ncbi:MAG: biotin--[acetyl-CoA-carboxylase] ligase [Burkholderiaceae bacterium]|nr:biotin--[acetyl-CoA-carboxylase] ligase [Burkholderiaceae bacterium]